MTKKMRDQVIQKQKYENIIQKKTKKERYILIYIKLKLY